MHSDEAWHMTLEVMELLEGVIPPEAFQIALVKAYERAKEGITNYHIRANRLFIRIEQPGLN